MFLSKPDPVEYNNYKLDFKALILCDSSWGENSFKTYFDLLQNFIYRNLKLTIYYKPLVRNMNVNHSNVPEESAENWIDLYGDFLYQHALPRLGNDSQLAEDMVQDTFLSALKSSSNFKGKSTQRTWFVTILRNKIIDYYRKNKDKIFEQTDFHNEEFIESGSQEGQWKEEFAPADWGKVPDKAFEQKEFNTVFDGCLNDLPKNISSVFALRELEGWETEKICKEMSITSSNLWVILHRARTQLRRCLELNWLNSDK